MALPLLRNSASFRTTKTIGRIRTALRRFLTGGAAAAAGAKTDARRSVWACELFQFRPPEAGAILNRRHAETGAENDPHPVRRPKSAIESDNL